MASRSIIVTAKMLKWICVTGDEGDTRVAATLIRNVHDALSCNTSRNLGRLVISKTRVLYRTRRRSNAEHSARFLLVAFLLFLFFFLFSFPFPRTDESIPRRAARNSHGISLAINYCPRTLVCRPQRTKRVSHSVVALARVCTMTNNRVFSD